MLVRLETNYGTMFVPDTDTAQYEWLRVGGASPEDNDIDAVRELLAERPKAIICDVGANFGCWSLALRDLATRVYAFEPQYNILRTFLKSARANRAGNIAVFDCALGAREGIATIAQVPLSRYENFGGIALNDPIPGCKSVPVKVLTLDSIVTEPVSFIKIDAEGAEIDILKGAAETVAKYHPVIFAEWFHEGTDRDALAGWLTEAGYACEQRNANLLCVHGH